MKKTLSITLGGRAYIVEEDAYGALERYVNKIRAQFKDDPNVDELVADMEAGMADVFEKQQGKRSDAALTLTDVEAMMAIMGAPEEIAEEEPVKGETKRDTKSDRTETSGSTSKRLYRNPDDVVIAGVCSGLAAYLGIDVVIVRIAFLILAFLNGIGIVAYIIFWIAMPEATTSAQKLEMRGKPVNLQEIEELVKEKAEKMTAEGKKAWSRMQDEKSPARRFLEAPVRFIGACARAMVMVASGLIKVLGGVIGVAIIVASSLAMAAATVSAAVMLFGIQSPYMQSDLPLHELVWNPKYYVAIAAIYLVVIFPLVFLIQIGGTFVTRRNQFKTSGIIAMTVIWFAALSTAAAMGTHLAPWAQMRLAETRAAQTVTQEVALSEDVMKVLLSGEAHLKVTEGDTTSLVLMGRAEDLVRATTTFEGGELRLSVSPQTDNGFRLCFFCNERDVHAELTLDKDAAALFNAQVQDHARLSAHELRTATTTVHTMDYARASVRASDMLDALAEDYSRIRVFSQPASSTIRENGYGRVEGLVN